MNNQFNIGDIITHTNPKRENTPWLVVGFTTFKRVSGYVEYYYKLVPLQRLDEMDYPYDVEIQHTHQNYERVS